MTLDILMKSMASSTIDTVNKVEIRSPASVSFISLKILSIYFTSFLECDFQSIDELFWVIGDASPISNNDAE